MAVLTLDNSMVDEQFERANADIRFLLSSAVVHRHPSIGMTVAHSPSSCPHCLRMQEIRARYPEETE